MKAIERCIECAEYDRKRDRCKRGASREENPQDPFYDDCPLPDVRPHFRGEWNSALTVLIMGKPDVVIAYKCSACGSVNTTQTPYCPYCGAKMNGGTQ